MLDQIEILLGDHKIQWIEFVDEIFTLDRQRIVDLCREITNRDLKFCWGAGTLADKVDNELLGMMREAGCRKITFGVETGSERIRFLGNKRITNSQYFEAVCLGLN